MRPTPVAVGILVSAGILIDVLAVLADPRGNVPLAWGAGALLMAAAYAWPRPSSGGPG